MIKLYMVQCFKDGKWVVCWNAGNQPTIFTDLRDAEDDLIGWREDVYYEYRIVEGYFTQQFTHEETK